MKILPNHKTFRVGSIYCFQGDTEHNYFQIIDKDKNNYKVKYLYDNSIFNMRKEILDKGFTKDRRILIKY